jgi:hypothetical protein
MSLIDYSVPCSPSSSINAVFLLPLLLRLAFSILFHKPLSLEHKRCYIQLSVLFLSSLLLNYYLNYFTYCLFLITLQIVLLSISTANSFNVPHYVEMFNTLSFMVLIFTPIPSWVGIAVVWGGNVIKNIGCVRFGGIMMALVQIAAGILAFLAASRCEVSEFYVMCCSSVALMIVQAEVFNKS